MKRFELVEGTANKFWEVVLAGDSVTTRWGRIGTPGQEKTKAFASPEAARKAHDALVAEKTGKGYREAKSAAPAKAAQSVDARRLALKAVDSKRTSTLYVARLDGQVAAVAGDGLLVSTDGRTFHARRSPAQTYALRLDADRWYAGGAGGHFATSSNRGESWTRVKLPFEGYVFAIHRDVHGQWWLGGSDGAVLSSSSPLKGWATVKVPGTGKRLRFLDFEEQLYVVGEGGGHRWDGRKWHALGGFGRLDIVTRLVATPSGALVAFGDRGLIARSTDGADFTKLKSPVTEDIEDAAFVAGALFAVGGARRGFVLRSTDEGRTFEVAHRDFARKLWSIASWGTGALLCGEHGAIAKLAAPDDRFFKGAVDELAPPPPALPQGFVVPTAVAKTARETAWEKLNAAAMSESRKLTERIKSRAPADANEKLAAVVDAGSDPSAPTVYADWLSAHGDVRGELAAIQQRLVLTPGDKALKAAERELFTKHRDAFLGPLHGFGDMLKLTWANGFIETARLANTSERYDGGGDERITVPALLERLLDHPSARFLRELTVGIVTFEDNDYRQVIAALGKRRLPALKKLFLGDFTSEETELSWSSLGPVEPLCGAAPNLETLILRSGNISLGKLVFPKLKTFTVESGGFHDLKSVCAAQWPSLERLELQVGQSQYGAETKVKAVAPLLDGAGLPRLVHLGLANSEFGADVVTLLAGSKLLAQLESLDLSKGTLGDEGAHLLASYAPAFAHLETLDLSENYLSDAGVKLVKGLCASVVVRKQRADEGNVEDRYAAVGE